MVRKRVPVLGIPIDAVSRREALDRIETFVQSGLPNQIATVNPEFVIAAQQHKTFKHALKDSELNVADGIGIRAAATFLRLKRPNWLPAKQIIGIIQGLGIGLAQLLQHPSLTNPLPETVTGIELLNQIVFRASQRNWRIYLVGGEPEVAKKVARILTEQYPSLIIVGAEEGISQSAPTNSTKDLVDRIRNTKPDILFVAFGAPKQDLFIAKNKSELGVPVMIGIGGAFDFLTGRVKRSPAWMQRIGLEWLWRLIVQPWRWHRILTATIVFPWRIYLSAMKQ